jgi:hypothetical protein
VSQWNLGGKNTITIAPVVPDAPSHAEHRLHFIEKKDFLNARLSRGKHSYRLAAYGLQDLSMPVYVQRLSIRRRCSVKKLQQGCSSPLEQPAGKWFSQVFCIKRFIPHVLGRLRKKNDNPIRIAVYLHDTSQKCYLNLFM